MKKTDLHALSTSQLVERFIEIALRQYTTVMRDEVAKFNKLYGQMDAVTEELKSRPGDQRRALAALYDHPNPQVRLKAAVRSLAVNYDEARRVLESLAKLRPYPQAGDAGMTLVALDRGIFKPE